MGLRATLIGVSHFGIATDGLVLVVVASLVLVGQLSVFENSGLTMARTRSASAHQKVLNATLRTRWPNAASDGTSMDAIAEASGVSKATIYKHWPDKDALLLDMMAEANGLHARPKFDSGDTRADIVAVLSYRPQERAEMR